MTYPGAHQITNVNACKLTAGANGTITIDVPIADVSLAGGVAPLNPDRLYSVTASTTTSAAAFNSVASLGGIGGVLFNMLDVAPGYDAIFGPTAAHVAGFAAHRIGQSVSVTWRTVNESGVAGFNVWRSGPDGRSMKANTTLVAAKHPGTLHGATYRFVDRSTRGGSAYQYRLQIVARDGTPRWYASGVLVR